MINLFPFQSNASTHIAELFGDYYNNQPFRGTKQKRRIIPFYQALEAITGSGKTAILADAIERIRPHLGIQPFVMWLSKGKVVVAQTYKNLQDGGKYRNIISSYAVHLLSEYRPEYATDDTQAHLFFATVGTFNQRDKEQGDRLIFKSEIDTAPTSIWEALMLRLNSKKQRRPLLIVYDEAHNLTDQQTKLLLDLEPDAFIVASATMRIPAQLNHILADLKSEGWTNDKFITRIDTALVAESGLVKDELSIGGFQEAMEQTIDKLLMDMERADLAIESERLKFKPKAIYVSRTNIVEGNSLQRDNPRQPFEQRQAPPIVIWRYLVREKKVDPATIAVYCNLDFDKNYPRPENFVIFNGGDADYENFTSGNFRHVIFNLSLQEGWDDPTCYFAYIDKSMGSTVQVEQLVGRLLRQPDAQHYESEILNTAHFYVRVDTKSVFYDVVRAVRSRLQADAPEIRVTAYGINGGTRPIDFPPSKSKTIPKVYVDPEAALEKVAQLIYSLDDYRGGGVNVRGEGAHAIIQQHIGENDDSEPAWVTIDRSNPVSARWVFQRAVMRIYPKALEIAGSDDVKFDAQVEFGSKAFYNIERLANDVVQTYFQYSRLRQQIHNPYSVGTIRADPTKIRKFKNSLHEGYAGLNSFENDFAETLDAMNLTWCRNVPRIGFGIRLLSFGPSREFYPDFLVWKGKNVFALDTTGAHILKDKIGRKLLAISAEPEVLNRIYVRLISNGKWDDKVHQQTKEGYTIWRLREDHELGMDHVEDLATALTHCLSEHQ